MEIVIGEAMERLPPEEKIVARGVHELLLRAEFWMLAPIFVPALALGLGFVAFGISLDATGPQVGVPWFLLPIALVSCFLLGMVVERWMARPRLEAVKQELRRVLVSPELRQKLTEIFSGNRLYAGFLKEAR